jgi:hypothetical protein
LQINFKRWFPLYTQANLKKEIHMKTIVPNLLRAAPANPRLNFCRYLCFTAALFVSAVLAAPLAAQQGAQRSAPPEIAFKQVAPDLYFLFDFESSNAGVLITEEGALVIDTRQHPRDGQDLLDRIRKITDKPVK